MICTEAAEFVSALCDGEIIPPTAAEHIGTCPACQARLRDYLNLGVELRRTASLEQRAAVPARAWVRPQNPLTAFLQKGWGTMRIPRLAFAAMIAGIVALACTLAVVKVGANSNGTVVLLTTTGPSGRLVDCPLSTVDQSHAACAWAGKVGTQSLVYRVKLLSRDGDRVRLKIGTGTHLEASEPSFDHDPGRDVWFQPGEPSKFDVPGVGTLTLTGQWLDHIPDWFEMYHMNHLFPGPTEFRLGSPLLVKDKVITADLTNGIGEFMSTDNINNDNRAFAIIVPGQGRFLLSQLRIEGSVDARVKQGRISFEADGHSWEILSGVPICNADQIWVLHQPDYKVKPLGPNGTYQVYASNPKLMQTASGEWALSDHQ